MMPPLPPKERPLPPPEKWGAGFPSTPQRIAMQAAFALVGFAVLHGIALAAWFHRAADRGDDAWTWRSFIAIACTALALAAAALVWRTPSRAHAVFGASVMALSLVRLLGAWTWASFFVLAITTILIVPLVRAVWSLSP